MGFNDLHKILELVVKGSMIQGLVLVKLEIVVSIVCQQ